MVEILLIRHGQSEADLMNRFEGRADYSLTQLGKWQANQLADWVFSQHKPDLLFSSPLKRAKETAEALASKLNLAIDFADDLMEQTNGAIDGMLKDEAQAAYPLPTNGWRRHESVQGGESVIQLRARAEAFISRINTLVETVPNVTRICIVSHGAIISMLFRSFLNLPYDSQVFLPTGDTGVHIWQMNNGNKTIIKTNSQVHLTGKEDEND